ncbi:MAG: autotransporter assembly complex protein TamA [Aeromonas sp.]
MTVLCVCALLWAQHAPAAPAESLTYKVSGVKGKNKKNVQAYLGTLPAYAPRQYRKAKEKIIQSVTDALQVYGYYQPTITLARDEEKPSQVKIEIKLGKPVLVRRLDILVRGDASSDLVYSALFDDLPLKEGKAFHHASYESLKADFGSLGLARGYFDAKLVTSTVKISPEEHSADVFILFDSGKRYRFGDVRYQATPEALKLIKPLLNFQPTDPYLALKLAELSQDVSSTKLFKAVDIKPLLTAARDGAVPIAINLTNRDQHEIETGIGVSTDVGPRLSTTWEKPWINRYGHRLFATAQLSQPEAQLSFDYQIPVGNPLRDYYSIQSGYQYKDLNDTQASLTKLGIHRWALRPESWDRDVFLRVEHESYTQGLDEGSSVLFIPGISWSRLRVRGGTLPDWGDRQQLTLEFSEPMWGSDIRFVRAWGRSKWLRTLAANHRFLLRAEQGWMEGDDISLVPPSLRFFTGGDQTVRGFGYENISPKDAEGNLSGGRYTSAASVEYNYRLSEKWLAALFVDTGTATLDYSEAWKVGTGIGVRWVTPVGQVRIDFAVGVSEQDKPFQLHFALGPEL